MDRLEFLAWVKRHTERHPRSDWPEPTSEFWALHRETVLARSITLAEAEAGSRRMARAFPPFLTEHLAAFLAAVRAHREEAFRDARPVALSDYSDSGTESDAEVARIWESLSDADRASWLDRARSAFPDLRPAFVRGIAMAWAEDPTKALPPQAAEPAPPRRSLLDRVAAMRRPPAPDTPEPPPF